MDLAAMRWTTWLPRRDHDHAPRSQRGPASSPVSERVLLAWGWLAVVLLFALYVAVLHHSVERAELIRSNQLSANTQAPARAGYYAAFSPRADRP